jgi:pimeloyl-ACP methyl ester carboxylesterase
MMTPTTRRLTAIASVAALVVGCAPRARNTTTTAAASAAALPAGPLAAAPDRFLAHGDVRVRYREIGRGEPVVLLHGLTRSSDDWAGVGDSLAVDRRVIALDLRGHGRSSSFTDRARFGTAMADDVVRLLDHLRIRRAHLVGHSMGAVIAANVTARYPARVVTATLIAPPIYADSAAYMQANGAWVADLERGAGAARFLQWLVPGTPDSAATAGSAAMLATLPAPTFAAVVGSISTLMVPVSRAAVVGGVPTLVAVGTGDPLLPQARWLASWWPGARLVEVPGANHGSITGSPEVWAAVRALRHARAATASPGG